MLVVVRRVVVLRGIDRQRVGIDHAGFGLLVVAAGIVERHLEHLGIGDELRD